MVATYPHHKMAAAHTLYIAKVCPYAHRSDLVAHELGVIGKEVAVEDVGLPTPAWYNKEVNPREMVPAIKLPNGAATRRCKYEAAIVCNLPLGISCIWCNMRTAGRSHITHRRVSRGHRSAAPHGVKVLSEHRRDAGRASTAALEADLWKVRELKMHRALRAATGRSWHDPSRDGHSVKGSEILLGRGVA
jgi:hypothetical protein